MVEHESAQRAMSAVVRGTEARRASEQAPGQAGASTAASDGACGDWRTWLSGASSREVLARIVPEDPLAIREHVALELRDGAYLLDAQRVSLRCFALVARHAARYRGRPDLGEWLRLLAREAIAGILRDDGEAERRPLVAGAEPGREHGEAFAALARPLGLDAEAMGRACLAFNRLAHADRSAFFALVIAGRTLDELGQGAEESPTEIARRARRALDGLLHAAATPAETKTARPAARADAPGTKEGRHAR